MDGNQAAIQNTELKTQQQNIIHFSEGILGFEDIHEYLLYHEDENNIIWSLQAANSDIPSFIVIDPFTVCPGYNPALTESELRSFGNPDPTDLCFLVIAVIRPEPSESVVNLKAPIVIDINTREAKQIILENSEYPLRYPLLGKQ